MSSALRDLGEYVEVGPNGARYELDPGHGPIDAHDPNAGVNNLPAGHPSREIHGAFAGGNHLARDHKRLDARPTHVSRNTLPPTKHPAEPKDRSSAATNSDPGQFESDTQVDPAGADLDDALLLILADALDDLERVRIATGNRIDALRRTKGLEGSRFDGDLADLHNALAGLEHQAELNLKRAMRRHPLHPFVAQTLGLGEKQAARLLAAIGNPADRPNVAKLWQYSGHGDPARSRLRRGQPVEFSPTAKMRVHLCAESMLRAGNRAIYDRERAKWADRDTTDGHRHAHALRVVGKTLLRDLWVYARAVSS